MIITIQSIARHRNGISGAPFYVVLFNDDESLENYKLGIVFDSPGHVAILAFGRLVLSNIAFGSNSYRGDVYEPPLRAAIAEYYRTLDALESPQTTLSSNRDGGSL
jgi:hypothetical protein